MDKLLKARKPARVNKLPAKPSIDLPPMSLFGLCWRKAIRGIRNPGKAFGILYNILLVRLHDISLGFKRLHQKKVDLLVLDTVFPHPLSPFRFQEFCSYLQFFPKTMILSNGKNLPALKDNRNLRVIIGEFENKTKKVNFDIDGYSGKIACMTFLNVTSLFLKSLERNKIPFIFTLYPGGGFEINSRTSDNELERIFNSPQFRRVIVTQQIVYDYLVNKHFCSQDKIDFIYGVVTPLEVLSSSTNFQKQFFGFEKKTLDICFVAHKYMLKGIDKGYDVFVEVAKLLSQFHNNINFHVVGSFDKNDIPLNGLEEKFTFYGLRHSEWFNEFYRDKDIILSPNVPFKIFKGSFDGFPTASCTEAGLRKVAVFCTDELKLNKYFNNNQEIVIIPYEVNKIADIIESYYSHLERLRHIGENGARKMREIYNYDSHILPRIKILENEIAKGKN
jgi:hypothetical protein